MAKSNGLGDNLYVGIYDLSGDVGSVQTIRGGPALLDVTGINKSAHERIGGLRDGEISFNAFFNDALLHEHVALSPLPLTDVLVSYFKGEAYGGEAACMLAKQVNYDWNRGTDGQFLATIQALANGYGLVWGKQLSNGNMNATGAANLTAVDFAGGGSLAFGLVAFLHVFAFDGTDITFTIKESSDDGGSDAYAAVTGGAFTQVTGPTTQRIVTSLTQTVERYLRVTTTTSGGFNSVDFAIVGHRHPVATSY